MNLRAGTLPRKVVANAFVLILGLNLSIVAANAQTTPLTPSLNVAGRSIGLEPGGLVIKLPDAMGVQAFYPRTNFMEIEAKLSGSMIPLHLEISLASESRNCTEWEKRYSGDSSSYGKKLSGRNGKTYDARWYPVHFDKKGIARRYCLDRPGTSVNIYAIAADEAVPVMIEFTSNIADALLPETVQARPAAAAAAAPASSVSVDGVYPEEVISSSQICQSNDPRLMPEVFCSYVQSFSQMQGRCKSGEPRSCVVIADGAAKDKDYKVASIYYRRACELGDKGACRKADSSAKKAGSN